MVRTQPSNPGGDQTGVPPPQTRTASEVEPGRAEGADILTHGPGTNASMAAPDRESGDPPMPVRGGSECTTSDGCGVRGRGSEKVGRDLDGQGLLCGGG